MSSIVYGGKVLMKPEVENENMDPMFDEGYPFKMPKVYIEGCGEEYHPQYDFTWADDSAVLVRENNIVKYTQSHFTELLAENEKGEIVWIDGRSAPYSDCWDGKYLGERRDAEKYKVEVFDLNTSHKTTYELAGSKTEEFSEWDKHCIGEYAGPEGIKEPFEVENGVLKNYRGADAVVNIPDTVTEIWYSVFHNYENIEKIIIPKSCVKIENSALSYLKPYVCFEVDKDNPRYYSENGCLIDRETSTLVRGSINGVIPSDGSVTKIGEKAFKGYVEMIHVNIPDTIVEIGNEAFANCENLESVSFSEKLILIGTHAFYHCRALTNVHLPTSLKEIGWGAFDGCSSLTSIDIPDHITNLGGSAFSGCEKLVSVKMPASITTLESHMFSNCSSLVNVLIPDSVTKIGDDAFRHCTALTDIKVPKAVIEIGDSAFCGCKNLVNVELPDSILEIGRWAFSGCASLVKIQIPESVSFVGEHMFYNCEVLETVELPSSITTIPESMFHMCKKLTNVNLPKTVTKIGSCAFSWCESLTNIEISTSIKKISRNAFYSTGLTNLSIPDSVKMIGDDAFANCRSLKEVNLPDVFFEEGKRIFGANLIKKEDVSALDETEINDSTYDYNELPF